MAMTVKEITEWLNGISDKNHVAVDEGGLCLVEVESLDDEHTHPYFYNYLDIGGIPDEE